MKPAVDVAKLPTRSTARAIRVCGPAESSAVGISALKVWPSACGVVTLTDCEPTVKSTRSTARLSVASTVTSKAVPRVTSAGTDVKPTAGGSDGSTV